MTEILFDKRNYRKHNQKNKDLIRKSLKELGAGRSIVIDNDGEIIGGNGVYEQAQKLNMPVKVIESDGKELIVVKRTDLSTGDEKRKRLAVMDNSTSDTSSFDMDLLKIDFELPVIKSLGVNIPKSTVDISKIDKYNLQNAEITYQPNGVNRVVSELYDFSSKRIDDIYDMISKVQNEELREMLRVRACWLAEFHYDKIADYYCNQATKEEQEIFEKLALVLLDKDKMIQNGYSELMEFVLNGVK